MSFITGFHKIAKAVCTPASELVEEHEHLIKVLRKHNPKQESREAKKQSKELQDYRKQVDPPKEGREFSGSRSASDMEIPAGVLA